MRTDAASTAAARCNKKRFDGKGQLPLISSKKMKDTDANGRKRLVRPYFFDVSQGEEFCFTYAIWRFVCCVRRICRLRGSFSLHLTAANHASLFCVRRICGLRGCFSLHLTDANLASFFCSRNNSLLRTVFPSLTTYASLFFRVFVRNQPLKSAEEGRNRTVADFANDSCIRKQVNTS